MQNDTPEDRSIDSLNRQVIVTLLDLQNADQTAARWTLRQQLDYGSLLAPHQKLVLDLKGYFYDIAQQLAEVAIKVAQIHQDLNDHQQALDNLVRDDDGE